MAAVKKPKGPITIFFCRIFEWVDDETGEYLPIGLVEFEEPPEVFEPPTRCEVCQEGSDEDLECSGDVYMCAICMGIDLDPECGEETPTIIPAQDSLLYGT